MSRIKTDYRNRLGEEALNHLLRITIEGPPVVNFNSKAATELFFSKEIHPNVHSSHASGAYCP